MNIVLQKFGYTNLLSPIFEKSSLKNLLGWTWFNLIFTDCVKEVHVRKRLQSYWTWTSLACVACKIQARNRKKNKVWKKNEITLKSLWTTLIKWKQGLCPELFLWHLSYFWLAQLGLQSNHLQYVSFGTIHILGTESPWLMRLLVLGKFRISRI